MIGLHALESTGISSEEIQELRRTYQSLRPRVRGETYMFEGSIKLDRIWEGLRIQDEFKIQIEIPKAYPRSPPLVRLTDDRAERIMRRWNLANSSGFHLNRNGTACLCAQLEIRQQFPEGISILPFIRDFIEHWLFGVSFFESNGRWPWKERSHGAVGILESFAEQKELPDPAQALGDLRRSGASVSRLLNVGVGISGSSACICGSGRKFGRCHPEALSGLRRLKNALAEGKVGQGGDN